MRNLHSIFLVLSFLMTSASAADEKPATMIKFTTRISGLPEDDFGSKPKVHYRAGEKFVRVQEAPDPKMNLQGLMIVSWPDYWSINLMERNGKHGKDKDTRSPRATMPVFTFPPDDPNPVAQMQFTREASFAREHGARPKAGSDIDQQKTDEYVYTIGDAQIGLWTKAGTDVPLRISCKRWGRSMTIDYLSYEVMDFDEKVFLPPPEISIKEIR